MNGCRAASPSLLAGSYSHGLQFTSLSRSPEFSSHHLSRFLSGAATSIAPAHAGTTQHLNMAVALLAFINGSRTRHTISVLLPLPSPSLFLPTSSSLTGEPQDSTTQITPGHTHTRTHAHTLPCPPLTLRNQAGRQRIGVTTPSNRLGRTFHHAARQALLTKF